MIPAFGVVVGGRLDGWRYFFERFFISPDDWALLVRAVVFPPHWPFPRTLNLRGGRDFHQLRGIPGERARRMPCGPLVDAAVYWHQQDQIEAKYAKPRK